MIAFDSGIYSPDSGLWHLSKAALTCSVTQKHTHTHTRTETHTHTHTHTHTGQSAGENPASSFSWYNRGRMEQRVDSAAQQHLDSLNDQFLSYSAHKAVQWSAGPEIGYSWCLHYTRSNDFSVFTLGVSYV